MAERIPVLASIADMGRNVGNAWMYGFNAPSNIASGNFKGLIPSRPHIGSVGGLATLGGLGMAGAVAGAAIGSQIEGTPVGAGAAIGGAIGMAGLPALGLASSAALPVAKAVGSLGLKAMGAIPGAMGAVGAGALSMATSAPVAMAASAAVGFSKSLINWNVDAGNLSKVRLSKLGVGTLAVAGAVNSVREAWGEVKKVHMGQNDGMVTRATPSYMNNAGATGDLVFAMNANRRG